MKDRAFALAMVVLSAAPMQRTAPHGPLRNGCVENPFARAVTTLWAARSSGAWQRSGHRLVTPAAGLTTYTRRAVNHLALAPEAERPPLRDRVRFRFEAVVASETTRGRLRSRTPVYGRPSRRSSTTAADCAATSHEPRSSFERSRWGLGASVARRVATHSSKSRIDPGWKPCCRLSG